MVTSGKKIIKLHSGDEVHHRKYGVGIVICEWGQIPMQDECQHIVTGAGIYDIRFINAYGKPFLHCCRTPFLSI